MMKLSANCGQEFVPMAAIVPVAGNTTKIQSVCAKSSESRLQIRSMKDIATACSITKQSNTESENCCIAVSQITTEHSTPPYFSIRRLHKPWYPERQQMLFGWVPVIQKKKLFGKIVGLSNI
jgi:hypothetical protein